MPEIDPNVKQPARKFQIFFPDRKLLGPKGYAAAEQPGFLRVNIG